VKPGKVCKLFEVRQAGVGHQLQAVQLEVPALRCSSRSKDTTPTSSVW
jgi:hypothetical protein